jgi:hypothetical protein
MASVFLLFDSGDILKHCETGAVQLPRLGKKAMKLLPGSLGTPTLGKAIHPVGSLVPRDFPAGRPV